jgi:hypothetical protein
MGAIWKWLRRGWVKTEIAATELKAEHRMR